MQSDTPKIKFSPPCFYHFGIKKCGVVTHHKHFFLFRIHQKIVFLLFIFDPNWGSWVSPALAAPATLLGGLKAAFAPG
jgi:hypothetical protein